jgi:hypothetical protein
VLCLIVLSLPLGKNPFAVKISNKKKKKKEGRKKERKKERKGPRYTLNRRLGGPQDRSRRCRENKIIDSTGTRPLGRPANRQSL